MIISEMLYIILHNETNALQTELNYTCHYNIQFLTQIGVGPAHTITDSGEREH